MSVFKPASVEVKEFTSVTSWTYNYPDGTPIDQGQATAYGLKAHLFVTQLIKEFNPMAAQHNFMREEVKKLKAEVEELRALLLKEKK